MVAVAHDQERLAGKFLFQPIEEPPVVLRAHGLAAQIFVDARIVAEIAPVQHQVRR